MDIIVREQACLSAGADRKGKLWRGGAPQGGDLRLLEDGSERGGALGSDLVVADTAAWVRLGR